jgi:hypothetical protein
MIKKSVALFSLLFAKSLFAADLQCPYTLVVTETAKAQTNWNVTQQTSAKTLQGWTIYEGKLGDTTSSMAPEESEHQQSLTQHWTFQADRNYWIQCRYTDSTLTLSRDIPHSVKRCQITYKLNKQHNIAQAASISCSP